jgi:uncharacterized membrane protein
MSAETGRIEAFSDGVFAIAITLLVLELKVPTIGNVRLSSALLRQWPSYAAFSLSFAFIGIMWVNHHRLFTHITRSTSTLLVLNLVLLFGVTVVPFPTAVLATYLRTADARSAALFYNGTYVAIAVLFNLLWRYAIRAGLLDPVKVAAAARISRQYSYGPLLYLVCLGVAWISPEGSLALSCALAAFFALPPHMATSFRELTRRAAG